MLNDITIDVVATLLGFFVRYQITLSEKKSNKIFSLALTFISSSMSPLLRLIKPYFIYKVQKKKGNR